MEKKSNVCISAIVCTHNRADLLYKTIKSLLNQTLTKEKYEIIVVDNLSTDETKNVVDSFCSEQIIYLYEDNLGLSHARNLGWHKAKGKYIAFIDDDAVAHPNWLENIIKTFAKYTPEPGVVGGRIFPLWEVARPPWISDLQMNMLSIVNFSDETRPLKNSEWLPGTNIAFLKNALNKSGGFSTLLGRKGKSLLSGEETLLHNQLRQEGYQIIYNPAICVDHFISSNRMKRGWILKRRFAQGRTTFTSEKLLKKKFSQDKFIFLIIEFIKSLIKRNNEKKTFDTFSKIIQYLGYLIESILFYLREGGENLYEN